MEDNRMEDVLRAQIAAQEVENEMLGTLTDFKSVPELVIHTFLAFFFIIGPRYECSPSSNAP